MRELGVNVSGDELMTLFSFFDHSGDGCDYNQFVWAFCEWHLYVMHHLCEWHLCVMHHRGTCM